MCIHFDFFVFLATIGGQLTSMTSSPYWNNAHRILKEGIDPTSEEVQQQMKRVLRKICSEWQAAADEDMDVQIICGGITNLLYRVGWRGKVKKKRRMYNMRMR